MWLVIITIGVYLGFLIGFNQTLQVSTSSCTNLVGCLGTVFSFIGAFFTVVTLGGFTGVLPLLIQGPLLFFFAITWGPIVVQLVINAVGAANL